ncbi:hypothetical protein [Streptomyces hokutonensis]|uniref:Uncharacterized protein n=1 Tax=Streptomyces hokutonensis TaxID=1306990 RepID=A0ABW6MDW1_9ACTN
MAGSVAFLGTADASSSAAANSRPAQALMAPRYTGPDFSDRATPATTAPTP